MCSSLVGLPALPGVGRGRRVPGVLAPGAARLRRVKGSSGSGWRWTARMGKAPLGGEETGPNPTDRAKKGRNEVGPLRAVGHPARGRDRGREPERPEARSSRRIASIPIERPKPTSKAPQHLCLDKGYDHRRGLGARRASSASPPHPLARRGARAEANARPAPAPAAGSSRAPTPGSTATARILTRWCKKPDNNRALLHLACGLICWRRALAAPLPG